MNLNLKKIPNTLRPAAIIQQQWQYNNIGYHTMEQYHKRQRGEGWAPGLPALPPQAIHSVQQEGSWKDKISTTANKGEEEDKYCIFYIIQIMRVIPGHQRTNKRPESKKRGNLTVGAWMHYMNIQFGLQLNNYFLYWNLTIFKNGLLNKMP